MILLKSIFLLLEMKFVLMDFKLIQVRKHKDVLRSNNQSLIELNLSLTVIDKLFQAAE